MTLYKETKPQQIKEAHRMGHGYWLIIGYFSPSIQGKVCWWGWGTDRFRELAILGVDLSGGCTVGCVGIRSFSYGLGTFSVDHI